MLPPEIRRRLPSHQYQDDEQDSIRVISYAVSPRSAISPPVQARDWSYRKPVKVSSEDDEVAEGVAVVRAGKTLMEQVAIQSHPQSAAPTSSSLLPSPMMERRPRVKEKWSDQPSEEERDVTDAGYAESTIEPSLYEVEVGHCDAMSSSDVSQWSSLFVPLHSGLPDSALKEQEQESEPYFISPSSASMTLAGIGRSLQWTQKFPQGRHLSRAKSRTTLRSSEVVSQTSRTSGSKLAEVRAGLRLLAKRREDVVEEQEEEPIRVAKWNRFKWILFISVIVVFLYGTLGFVASLLTWAGAWDGAEVSTTVDTDLIILMTVASSLCLLTSIVGFSGSILNSRPVLTFYAFLLWPSLISILAVGYTSYKRNNLRLDLKLNQTWSRYMDDLARLRVQEVLKCCGYYSPLHQATFSRYCYPRTTLPGCKGPLYRFEKRILLQMYTVTFSIVFVHIGVIAASLLCSNHVNVTFGKGLTPRAYRLDVGHVRRNAVNIIQILSASASHHSDIHHLLQVDEVEPFHEKSTDDSSMVWKR